MKLKRWLAAFLSVWMVSVLFSCGEESPSSTVAQKEPEIVWRTLEEYRTVMVPVPYTVEMPDKSILEVMAIQGADRLYESFLDRVERLGAAGEGYDVRLAYLFRDAWEAAMLLDAEVSYDCNSARMQLIQRVAEFSDRLLKEEKRLSAYLLYVAVMDLNSSMIPYQLLLGDAPFSNQRMMASLAPCSYEKMTPEQRRALQVGDVVAAGALPNLPKCPILWQVTDVSPQGVELKSLFVVNRMPYQKNPVQTLKNARVSEAEKAPFQFRIEGNLFAFYTQEEISYLQSFRPEYSSPKDDLNWEISDLRGYLNQQFYETMSEQEKELILKTEKKQNESVFGESLNDSIYISDTVEKGLVYWCKAACDGVEKTVEADGFATWEGIWSLRTANWEYRTVGVTAPVEQHSLLAVSPRSETIYSEYAMESFRPGGSEVSITSPYSVYSVLDGKKVSCEVQDSMGVIPCMRMAFEKP